jgi:hypothetical protein
MLADELSELARQVEDLKNRAAARQLKKKERKFQPIAGTSPGPVRIIFYYFTFIIYLCHFDTKMNILYLFHLVSIICCFALEFDI